MKRKRIPQIRNNPGEYKQLRDFSSAHPHLSYHEQLEAANAVDLRDNAVMIQLEDGWMRIEPIDTSKRYKKNKE